MMLIYIFLLALGHVSFGKTLPKDAPANVCHRSNADLNTCLLQQAGPALKLLQYGIPEWGMEPIEPLKIDFMSAEGDLTLVKVKMVMKNITLIGHSNATFNRVKFDPISQNGDISFNIPRMQMTCDYFATGRLFVIPLESSAHFDGNFTGINMTLSFRLNNIEKKGKEYFTVDKMAMKMHVDTAHIRITSIDPANQQQVNVIQDFFNENDRLVLDTVNPIVNEYGGEFYKHIIENYIRRIPANDLLPK